MPFFVCYRKRRGSVMVRLLGMRLLTRLLLLVCSLSLISLLFLSRCGLNNLEPESEEQDTQAALPGNFRLIFNPFGSITKTVALRPAASVVFKRFGKSIAWPFKFWWKRCRWYLHAERCVKLMKHGLLSFTQHGRNSTINMSCIC